MNVLSNWWPQWFPDGVRLPFREQLAVHVRANVLMLRAPRAVLEFCVWSLLPLGPLLLVAWAAGWIGGEPRGLESSWGLATFAGVVLSYLLLQHLAFVKAIDRTYLPYVRQALCERGLKVCLRCGHRLIDRLERCAECGARVADPSPRERSQP